MAQVPVSRDIAMTVQLGNLAVSMNAEGVSWNPSIARDMQDRIAGLMRDALQEAAAFDLLQQVTELPEDEYADTGEVDDGE